MGISIWKSQSFQLMKVWKYLLISTAPPPTQYTLPHTIPRGTHYPTSTHNLEVFIQNTQIYPHKQPNNSNVNKWIANEQIHPKPLITHGTPHGHSTHKSPKSWNSNTHNIWVTTKKTPRLLPIEISPITTSATHIHGIDTWPHLLSKREIVHRKGQANLAHADRGFRVAVPMGHTPYGTHNFAPCSIVVSSIFE